MWGSSSYRYSRYRTGLYGGSSYYYNRYAEGRNRRYSSSSYRPTYWSSYSYGPSSTYRSRNDRNRSYWSDRFPDAARRDEEEKREKERREEERRLKEEELEKKKQLKVNELELHIDTNATEHHTDAFDGKDSQLVLRRGQEFCITVTFNRTYYKEQDDLMFVLEADDESPGKNLKERFEMDEDGTDTYRQDEDFGARIIESDSQKNTLKIAIYIPVDCVVGEWDFRIKTRLRDEKENLIYKHPTPFIILFNPWSPADKVFMEDQELLEEYILNENGIAYRGSYKRIGYKPWFYGQENYQTERLISRFEEGILDICLDILLKAFGFKMTPDMADPILVSRALSMIVNSQGDDGVLVGKWGGSYLGGKKPTYWSGSTAILRQYDKRKKPVKYGQCWVFSHLLTTVCRALGLPCRSVTNFVSAHDCSSDCIIDKYCDEDGEEFDNVGSDSIWNFHVWNEVWILRPDLPILKDGNYNGWHVIDSTPQETSFGKFQCGPCPVEAVRRGHTNIGCDTTFVFSEVNADVVKWTLGDDLDFHVGDVYKHHVGKKLSTKPPGEDDIKKKPRLDLTSCYKYPEGSQEEREATKSAIRFSRHGDKLLKEIYKSSPTLEVWIDTDTPTMIGSDLVVTAYVKNVSEENKRVRNNLSVRSSTYWDLSTDTKLLAKERFPDKFIKPGQTENYSVTIPYKTYKEKCDDMLNVYVFANSRDVTGNLPHFKEESLDISIPELDVEGPESAQSGEKVTVTVSFTNPLPEPLTGCEVDVDGNLKLAEDDSNGFKYDDEEETHRTKYKDVDRGQKMVLTLRLVGRLKPNEVSKIRNMEVNFNCNEIGAGVNGCVCLTIIKPA